MKKNDTILTGVKEIARRANVSIATVDRVIHNRTGVSQQTKDKINEIISQLNYQPNLLAQRLASRKVLRLATLIPRSSDETSFWEAPLKGIEQADAEINQFATVIDKYFYDQNLRESFIEQTEIILKSKPNGVLLAPSFIEESITFTDKCKELNIPYVLIDSDIPNQGSLSYIGPNLYHSGYLGAHLISYLIKEQDSVLLVNISKEIDNHHHLLKKEEGFRAYFEDHQKANDIFRIDIKQTDYQSIEKNLTQAFDKYSNIKVVFVTNSRVSDVAHFIENHGKNIILIGYDFLNKNIEYLDKGTIDFLICQKPLEQAYRGVMALYQHLAISLPVENIYFMPIDILTKENYSFYRN
ncbi:MAG TPA: substrate-binding domain-containing protein [Sphingobacteriaceae bacterium]